MERMRIRKDDAVTRERRKGIERCNSTRLQGGRDRVRENLVGG